MQIDSEKFKNEYESWKRDALAIAMKALGNYDMAEDVTHNAFIKMHSKPREHIDAAGRKAYFFRVVRTCVVDLVRIESTEKEKQRGLADMVLYGEGSEIPKSTSRTTSDRLHALLEAISKLDDKGQLILHMVYTQKLKVSEVAELLDMTPAHVSTKKYQSIQFLRNRICPIKRARKSLVSKFDCLSS